MTPTYRQHLKSTLASIEADGLFKRERIIGSAQGTHVILEDGREVLNFCANNYLGLGNHPELIAAGHAALDRWGYGAASVRFICGTQGVHRELEQALSNFLSAEDTILFGSCFDANGGVFETLLTAEDAVISDALNHASIIDGVRLCKAQRYRYANRDLADLEQQLQNADEAGARFKLIVTDGVFSMDGFIAPLREICDLADKYKALVMVDDSHAVGFMGPNGRGTPELCGVEDRIDINTGTLGKALGGASGGYISGRQPIIDLLRQRARPYLFSNTLAPTIAAGSLAALKLLTESTELRDKLEANTRYYRAGLEAAGLRLQPGEHPIVPVMVGDAALSQKVSARLLELGVYAIGFFFPVVPRDQARIRTQVCAAHTTKDLDAAIAAFTQVKQEFGL
ncbi:MAG: glycine C-acetyltransferase [Opitutaceae bacterium]|jgi:glycine C-acetyltransferase|nr:glycine C-acetyltransferase [Opitutaceae bacterium]